jgi:hypothetical protein
MAERMSDRYVEHDRNGSSKYQFHSSSHMPTLAPMEIMTDGSAMDVSGMKGEGTTIFTKYSPEELGMDIRGTPFEKAAESVQIATPSNATFQQQGTEIAFQDGSVSGGASQYQPGATLAAEDRFASGRRLVSSLRDFVASDVGMTLVVVGTLASIYTLGKRRSL